MLTARRGGADCLIGDEAREIRGYFSEGWLTVDELSAEYQLPVLEVERLIRGDRWPYAGGRFSDCNGRARPSKHPREVEYAG